MADRTSSSSNIVTKNQPSPENDYEFPSHASKSTSDPPPASPAPPSKPSSATSLASLLGVAKKVVKSQSPSQLSVPSRTTFSNTKWSRVVKNPLEAATDGNETAGGVLGISTISGVTTMANSSGNDSDNSAIAPSEVITNIQNTSCARSRTSAAVGPTLDEAAGVARRERDRAAGAEDETVVAEQPSVSTFRAPGKRLGDVMDDKNFVNPTSASTEKSQAGSTGLFGSGSFGGIAAALLKAPNTWAPFPQRESKERMEQSSLQETEAEEGNKTVFKPSSPTSMPSQVAIAIGRFSSSSTATRTTLLQDPSPSVSPTAHSKSVVNSRSSAFMSSTSSTSSSGRMPTLGTNNRAVAGGPGTTSIAATTLNPSNLLYSLSEVGPDANTNWRTRSSRDRSPDEQRGQTDQFQSVRSSKIDKSSAVRKKHLQSDDSRTADLCSADLRSTDPRSADFTEGLAQSSSSVDLNLPAPPFSPPPFSNFSRTPPSGQKAPTATEPPSEDCRRGNPRGSDGSASVVYLMRHAPNNSTSHPQTAQSQVLLVDSDRNGIEHSPELFHCNNQNGSSTPPDQRDAVSSSSSNLFSRRYLDSAGCAQPYQHYHYTPTPSYTHFMLTSAGNGNMNSLQCNRPALNSSSSNFRNNWEGLLENSDNDDFTTFHNGPHLRPDHHHHDSNANLPCKDRAQPLDCLDRRVPHHYLSDRPDLFQANRPYLRHSCGTANPAIHDDPKPPHEGPLPKTENDEHTRVFDPATAAFSARLVPSDHPFRPGKGKEAHWDASGAYLHEEECPSRSSGPISGTVRGRSTEDSRLSHMAPLMVPVCRVHPGLARAIARQHVSWPESNGKPSSDEISSMSPMQYPNQNMVSQREGYYSSAVYPQVRDRQRGEWGREEGVAAAGSSQYRFQSKLPPASPLEMPLNGTASTSLSSLNYASGYTRHPQYRDTSSSHQLNAAEGASNPLDRQVAEQFRQRHLQFDNGVGDVSRHISGGLPSTVKTGVSAAHCASEVNRGMHVQIPIAEGRPHPISSSEGHSSSPVIFNDSNNPWPLPDLYAEKMAHSISPFHSDLWISPKSELILLDQFDENRRVNNHAHRGRHEELASFVPPGRQAIPSVADPKNRRRKEKRPGLPQVGRESDPSFATEIGTGKDSSNRRSSSNEDHSGPAAQAENDASSGDAAVKSRQPQTGGQRRIASTGSSVVEEKQNKLGPPVKFTRNGKSRNSPSKRTVANTTQASNGARGLVSTAAAIAQLHRTGVHRQQQEGRGNPSVAVADALVDISGSSKLSKLSTTTEAGSCASNFHSSSRRGNNGTSSLGGSGSRRGNGNNRSVLSGTRSATRGTTKGPKSKVA